VTGSPNSREGWANHPSCAVWPALAVGVDLAGATGLLFGYRAFALGLAAGLVCLLGELLRPGRLRIGLGLPLRCGREPSIGLAAAAARFDTALREAPLALANPHGDRHRQDDERGDDQDEKSGAHETFVALPTAGSIHAVRP
jgi:hypothetical protein